MIVRLQGGLGNQLFQAAFGIARSERRAEVLYLHPHCLGKGSHRPYALGVFNHPWNILPSDEPIFGARFYSENSFAFDKEAEGQPKGTYFIGNWQSERYFSSHADQIRALFTLHKFLTPGTRQWLQKIKFNKPYTCAIHVRRTDYLNVKHYHGMMDAHWYEDAVEHISQRSFAPIHFYIFSDDPAWCKENFPKTLQFKGLATGPVHEFSVVDVNGMGSGDAGPSSEHEDLYLMSQCDHAIIPNSSFGWWGAWLGDSQKDRIVIAPKNWFTPGGPASNFDTSDLIPQRWVRL